MQLQLNLVVCMLPLVLNCHLKLNAEIVQCVTAADTFCPGLLRGGISLCRNS